MNYWIASVVYLRSLDYSNISSDSNISIPYFENNEKFDYKMKFLRREMIKTDIGEINALVFAPKIPENKLFKGEEAVKFWLSDDINNVPLKPLPNSNPFTALIVNIALPILIRN